MGLQVKLVLSLVFSAVLSPDAFRNVAKGRGTQGHETLGASMVEDVEGHNLTHSTAAHAKSNWQYLNCLGVSVLRTYSLNYSNASNKGSLTPLGGNWQRLAPHNTYLGGVHSQYSTSRKDRNYEFFWYGMPNSFMSTVHRWTRWSSYTHPFEHDCDYGYVLTGLASNYSSSHRDRIWRLRCTKIHDEWNMKQMNGNPTNAMFTALNYHVNHSAFSWNQNATRHYPNGWVMSGMWSSPYYYHSVTRQPTNRDKHDRSFGLKIKEMCNFHTCSSGCNDYDSWDY